MGQQHARRCFFGGARGQHLVNLPAELASAHASFGVIAGANGWHSPPGSLTDEIDAVWVCTSLYQRDYALGVQALACVMERGVEPSGRGVGIGVPAEQLLHAAKVPKGGCPVQGGQPSFVCVSCRRAVVQQRCHDIPAAVACCSD